MTAPAAGRDLVRLHQVAERFFRSHLPGSWVPAYLADRGFGPVVQRRWHAGYAPPGPTALTRHLRALGYSAPDIVAAGLARRSRGGGLADIFRDRAVLPIRSGDGVVVAFAGRARAGAKRAPKYLNSPATSLYDKSSVLFGLWEARRRLARGARPVIVEGPFDVLAVEIADREGHAGVAPCGTALTAQHVAALRLVADLRAAGVVVAFDRDGAGLRAAARAYRLLRPSAPTLLAASLPPGADPAQVLTGCGPAVLAGVLAAPVPLADLVIDAELAGWERWLAYPGGRINALRATAPVVAAMPAQDVARQVARLAGRLGLDYATVTDAVTTAVPGMVAAGRPDRRSS